ncbi:hypothetical protein NUW54_g13125 [Trametes sanguinea]|uniref:Uncharacterized protein n=1 Tax=Trametes sanguinea TaxID=158606 RepID=A0ACC1MQZ0_9APHY|nr:hypothetical protein NUW54_g13125 [Trametes sanguinea]
MHPVDDIPPASGASGNVSVGAYLGDEELDDSEATDALAELVQAAIDSSEPLSEGENDFNDSIGGNLSDGQVEAPSSRSESSPSAHLPQSASAPLGSLQSRSTGQESGRPLLLTAENVTTIGGNPASSQDSSRRRTSKPKPVQIPLSKLFLYPARSEATSGHGSCPSPPFSPSSPLSPSSNLSKDQELRRRFDFVWTGGIRAYHMETVLD